MVNLFIQHVLRPDKEEPGAYGHTSSYYGAVEQQGRLTLHLHLIAWVRSSLSPQEIRDRLLEEDSEFQKQFVAYLESAHTGDYFNGTGLEVIQMRYQDALLPDYQDPTETLPVPPPPYCDCKADNCVGCDKTNSWWIYFKRIVDSLISMVNVHNCHQNTYVDGTLHSNSTAKGCKDNKWGKCRGCFPWPLFESTTVDSETAHVNMKKREAWINTFTPILTYLLRCNTDVTSLRSGTAIKAVLIYVSDYITKPALKTHVFFDVIKSVFQRNKEQTNTTKNGQDQARKLMTQMVNVLGAKMEIGAPMICSYLLGLPDHYTNCTFVTFYWKSFVSEVRNSWKSENEPLEEVKIQIKRKDDKVIGVSPVEDYMKRSVELESMCLYEWISRCEHMSNRTTSEILHTVTDEHDLDPTESILENKGDDCVSDTESMQSHSDDAEGSLKDFIEDNSLSADIEPVLDDFTLSQKTLVDGQDEYDNLPMISTQSTQATLKFSFLESHPLHDTHYISMHPEHERYVPNFVGGLLPRHDIGDRDYYCTTMLTLFKPWRCGMDLKTSENTWDHTFNLFMFEPWQIKLMSYFNLRYECLDAKDNYHAQLKQGDADPLQQFDTNWTTLDSNASTIISPEEIETGVSSDINAISKSITVPNREAGHSK
ncbi:hypothetical protein EV421DRAFT_1718248 [Armillaria borealis]|uniref:Helitron helicase-like domain-containing protein n=1 Tax=Armillaria borealis TaxID=47425 RepID=A0AA39J096_9AGAR|nr:hypothetical protein EV421DRAFT_1718248 [Armillaria borealis]